MIVVAASRFRSARWMLARYAAQGITVAPLMFLWAATDPANGPTTEERVAVAGGLLLVATILFTALDVLLRTAAGGRNRLALDNRDLVHLMGRRVVSRWPLQHIAAIRIPHPPAPRRIVLGGWFTRDPGFAQTWLHLDVGDRWSPRNGDQNLGTFYLTAREADAAQRAVDEALRTVRPGDPAHEFGSPTGDPPTP